jgi:phage shock protein C
MQDSTQTLLTRDDTLLGVCEGLGEDLGFNPLLLRLALTVTLFFFPLYTILGYLGAGALVALTRWIAPVPTARIADVPQAEITGANDAERQEVQLAA